MKIEERVFGRLSTGEAVYLLKISFESGVYYEITNFGATWVSAVVPDRHGQLDDVLLGYANPEGYYYDDAYIGSTIGRFANRISNSSFKIGEATYFLDSNEGVNCNHGGWNGFHKRVFNYEICNNEIWFSLFSQDGDGGFPGNINLKVGYIFTDDAQVSVVYEAVSDKDTYLNITNHAYFNLKGEGTVHYHSLIVPANRLVVADSHFIPTGEIVDVSNSIFDFSSGKRLGCILASNDKSIIANRGLNHCFMFDNPTSVLKNAAELYDLETGRVLDVKTTQPAIVVYSAGFLNSVMPGKKGTNYTCSTGICLETQQMPDYPNRPEFKQGVLKAHEVYRHENSYRFAVR